MQKATTKVINKPRKRSIWKDRATWELQLLLLPEIIGLILFHYTPLFNSLIMPFKDYKISQGILGSQWCGFQNFMLLSKSYLMERALRNTILYGVWFLLFTPVVNVFFALLMFDVKNRRALKYYQTTMYLPNFMSMVIVGYISYAILSPKMGLLNNVIEALGGTGTDWYMESAYWPLILTIVNVWKGVGGGTLLYYAQLMGIDTSLYEAAQIDGANHWQQVWNISIPHLVPVVVIGLIMGSSSVISGNFDLSYVITRNVTRLYSTTDNLATFTYRALVDASYEEGAAIGLVQSFCGLFLVVLTNAIIRKISPDNSLF